MDENQPQQNTEKNIKVLRTYTSDMADAIRTNEVSVIKIALAEKEKREREEVYKEAEGTNTSKTFLIIGGVVLITLAVVGSYFLIRQKNINDAPVATIKNIDTFIAFDAYQNIDISNVTNTNDMSNIIKQTPSLGGGLIKVLFPTKNTNETVTSNKFLSALGINPPGALTRSLSDKYLIGKYSNTNITPGSDNATVFIILENKDYNLTYASTLDWEKSLLRDVYVLFNINITDPDSLVFYKQWQDIVVNNKDARVLYGENGEAILYYVFVNKNTFVLTSNIETLKEIITRLITKNATSV
ncbi:MAG: hypothetical protein NTU81_02020 [Candidatus Nomurabacteria bacterium]|nr:hypothetical protein [Candidatus Nomurabacteria bacterium]